MPVAMTSPGFNVACRLTNAIMFATLQIISAADECCFRSPLTQQLIRRFCGSGMSSAVTRNGPRGKKPSSIFPATHWLVASCAPHAVRSFAQQYPPTYPSASLSVTSRASRPLTTASSASYSACRGGKISECNRLRNVCINISENPHHAPFRQRPYADANCHSTNSCPSKSFLEKMHTKVLAASSDVLEANKCSHASIALCSKRVVDIKILCRLFQHH